MAARSAKSKGEAALTGEQVVAAALAYIDTHGLDAFSMRNLARELGVYPTALYWHAGNRDKLLAEAVTLALRGVSPPDELTGWAEWLMEFGRRFRAALQRHPNLAMAVSSQLVSNASSDFSIVEMLLAKLHEAGFRGDALVDAYNVMIGCTIGFVGLELAVSPDSGEGGWGAELEQRMGDVRAEEYPHLAANLDGLANQAFGLRWKGSDEAPLDRAFEAMLDMLKAGLRQRLEGEQERPSD